MNKSSLRIEFRYWAIDPKTTLPKDITLHPRGGISHSIHYPDIHPITLCDENR